MNEKTYPESIPYVVHEDHMCRMERTIKRLWILCIIIFVALIGTNAGWIIYESQYQDVVITESQQDGAGVNIISGKDVQYGAESKDDTNESET